MKPRIAKKLANCELRLAAMVALTASGWSPIQIAKAFEISPSVVEKRIRQHENALLTAHNPTV